MDKSGKVVDLKPFVHQLYDGCWRRLQLNIYGGAINADEPGFGKNLVLLSWIFERQLALRYRALEGYFDLTTAEDFNRSPFRGKHLPPSDPRDDTPMKCLPAYCLDIACPCEGPQNYVGQIESKPGIVIVIVLAKTFANRLPEITKLVDMSDRKIMQLRVFYAHDKNRYKNVNTEPLTKKDKRLLQCSADGSAKPDALAVKNGFGYNLTVGQFHVDEFHDTKSDEAPACKSVTAYKDELIEGLRSGSPKEDGESNSQYHRRLKDSYQLTLPYVFGYSVTLWSKSFHDLAAMMKSIEQLWWAFDRIMKHMIGSVCREIGKKTENMESRITEASEPELKGNVADMKRVLDRITIKRTVKSKTIDGDNVLVVLSPHETRKTVCPLSDAQRKILRDADQTIMNQAKAEHIERCHRAVERGQDKSAPSYGGYFGKAHKLRAATVIPAILEFAKEPGLKLADDEMRNDKNCHGSSKHFAIMNSQQTLFSTKIHLHSYILSPLKLTVTHKRCLSSLKPSRGASKLASNLIKYALPLKNAIY